MNYKIVEETRVHFNLTFICKNLDPQWGRAQNNFLRLHKIRVTIELSQT